MIRTTIGVDKMMCGMCEAHVNDAIRKSFDVKSVKSNRKKKVCVVVSQDELDEEAVRAVICAAGYDVLGIESEPYQKSGFALFSR